MILLTPLIIILLYSWSYKKRHKNLHKHFSDYLSNEGSSTIPANIRLDEDVFKTSSRPYSSSSSEDVLKASLSWRHLDQEEQISLSLVDVFKMSWSRPIHSSWSYVFKTCSRRFQGIFKTSSRCLSKKSSKRLQDVFKTCCKNVFKTSSRRLQDVFKMSSRHFQDVLQRCPQEAFKTYYQVMLLMLKCFQDVFKTYSQCFWGALQSQLSTQKDLPRFALRNHGKRTKFVRVTTVSQVLIFHFTTLVAAYRGAFTALPNKGAFFAKTLHDFKLLIFSQKSSIADVPLSCK